MSNPVSNSILKLIRKTENINCTDISHGLTDCRGFGNGIFYKNNLWLSAGGWNPNTLRINTVTDEITEYSNLNYTFFVSTNDGYVWGIKSGNSLTVDKISIETGKILVTLQHNQTTDIYWPGGCYDGFRYVWFAPFSEVGFLKIDNWTNTVVANIPYNNQNGCYFRNCIYDSVHNCIWTIPLNSRTVVKIDNDTNELTELVLNTNNWVLYWKGYFVGDYLYLIPDREDNILKINRSTNEITQIYHGKGYMGLIGGCLDKNNNIWLAPYWSEDIAMFNTTTEQFTYFPQTAMHVFYCDAEYFDEHVYFLPRFNELSGQPCDVMRIDINNTRLINHYSVAQNLNFPCYGQILLDPENTSLWMFSGRKFLDDTNNPIEGQDFAPYISKINLYETISTTLTDSNGDYCIRTRPGKYKVIAGKKNNISEPSNIDESVTESISDQNFVVKPFTKIQISGKIKDG